MKKRGLQLLCTLFVIILLLPSVFALSVSGNKLSPIIYEPGKVIITKYTIGDTKLETEVIVHGEISKYITLSETVNDEFTMTIAFPDEIIEAGTHWFTLVVRELEPPSTGPGVGSLLAVNKRFRVEVYTWEKVILAGLSAPSVNVGTPVNFGVSVQSRTYQDIEKIWADITVYDRQRNVLGQLHTEEQFLPTLGKMTLVAPPFSTEDLVSDEYYAEAIVHYDGKQTVVNATFNIGSLDLILKEYTTELDQGFSEFIISVLNNWGGELRNVYAKVSVNDEEILQTPTISLPAWGEGELKGIAKIDLPAGTYDGYIDLFFEGETKREPITILVREKEEVGLSITMVILIAVLATVVVVIILGMVIYYLVNKKKQQPSKQEKKGGKIKKKRKTAKKK